MGLFGKLKKRASTTPIAQQTEPLADPTPLDLPNIPDLDVTRNLRIGDLDKGRGAASIPANVKPTDGPLGKELPYRVDTSGYRTHMKNIRPGKELALTMRLRKPMSIYPQIEVLLGEECVGILEVFRAELFAPAVQLAEDHDIKFTMDGITETFNGRVEPFIYLPDPQILYDAFKHGIEAAASRP